MKHNKYFWHPQRYEHKSLIYKKCLSLSNNLYKKWCIISLHLAAILFCKTRWYNRIHKKTYQWTQKISSKFCIRYLSNLCKNDLHTVLGRNLFSIANDCSVINLSDLSKMLVKKQMKYFDVPLDHAWKVPVLQDLLNKKSEKFICLRIRWLHNNWNDKYVMLWVMINVVYLCIILHICFSFVKLYIEII